VGECKGEAYRLEYAAHRQWRNEATLDGRTPSPAHSSRYASPLHSPTSQAKRVGPAKDGEVSAERYAGAGEGAGETEGGSTHSPAPSPAPAYRSAETSPSLAGPTRFLETPLTESDQTEGGSTHSGMPPTTPNFGTGGVARGGSARTSGYPSLAGPTRFLETPLTESDLMARSPLDAAHRQWRNEA
jgi:hypothetical protein